MKFLDKMAAKIVPLAQIIADNKFLLSLRDGFMVAFPATMFASIMIIIQNFPTTFGFADKLPEGVNVFLNDFFGPVGNATMSVGTLFIVLVSDISSQINSDSRSYLQEQFRYLLS